MGFTTGLTGGVTLTLGIAYLTVLAHERNRTNQALALRAQSRVLQSLVDRTPHPSSRTELARQEPSSLTEAAKERWNKEIENAVRWVQMTDWNEVRDDMEASIMRLFGNRIHQSQERIADLESKSVSKVQEALNKSKATISENKDHAVASVQRAATSTKESINNSGVVDAARNAVRNVVGKTIEKSKEAIGKVEVATAPPAGAVMESDVERVLHERYEKPHDMEKSVEEILEERYKPIDSRDNNVLRGV
ncbi:hypothetical protein F5884DRAFT_745396 [Xylogone sp. PMI_703]|nr:hypothetical protein F5884DRAFT_745396 [Xylogone sp. PMI_703]